MALKKTPTKAAPKKTAKNSKALPLAAPKPKTTPAMNASPEATATYTLNQTVKEVRAALKPTGDEIAKRSARDKLRPGLLQHELAKRMRCSTSTVRDLERDTRLPSNQAILANFYDLLYEAFGKS